DPSRAGAMSALYLPPIGNTPVAETPLALYTPGAEPWIIQGSTSPVFSFLMSRYQRTCGFVHCTRVSVPVTVFGEFLSNSAWPAWCARAGMAAAIIPAATRTAHDCRDNTSPAARTRRRPLLTDPR